MFSSLLLFPLLALGGIAAGAAALGSILSGVISGHAAKKNQQRQNAFTERMWNMTNTYNSPAQSVQRYKAAGINPAIAANSGNLNVPAQTVEGASPSYNNNYEGLSNLGSSFVNGYSAAAQGNLSESQQENTDANTVKTQEETEAQRIDNKRKAIDLAVEEYTKADRIKGVKAASDKIRNDADLTLKQIEFQEQNNWVNKQTMQNQVDSSYITLETQKIQRDIALQNYNQQEERFAYEIQGAIADIKLKYAQKQLTNAQAKAALINAAANAKSANALMMNAKTNRMVGKSQARFNNSTASYNEMVNGSVKAHGAFYETKLGQSTLRKRLDDNIHENNMEELLTGKGVDAVNALVQGIENMSLSSGQDMEETTYYDYNKKGKMTQKTTRRNVKTRSESSKKTKKSFKFKR